MSSHARQGALNRRSALTTGFSALIASLRDTFGVRIRYSDRLRRVPYAAQTFAASMPLIRRPRPPQRNFLRLEHTEQRHISQ
ncbi:hypothetical protein H4F33_09160 [Pectobacterium brasiliense]|uniref:Uncharacterized protein n=1 Tax=Pectobacterium brasiliense TaxID=180957 RepID=A0AAE3BEW4_9GAMM|nr:MULTISPECIES: hypothetical protein [Pectobacterium]MBA0216888.1 hypothetical protein [Pectobacterium brasiliense]MBN3050950.1 hypothetical protein [Pectobacterium brasiliense]MBN3072276.1 hypothetical protein [Pectobacterium brasiliense]MBN3168062.1 hypothetical protein [Pectobacterium brasiliense]URG53863.1 hypothetical protein IG605_006040 [Pectobacterium quasiaquaticum]